MSFRSLRASRRTCVVESGYLKSMAPWSWWVTLTFSRHVRRDGARKALQSWLRGVARDLVGDHVKVAWVIEPTRLGVDHVHLLLAVPVGQKMNKLAAEQLWRRSDPFAGFVHAVLYKADGDNDPRFGAAGYLAAKTDWNVTVACPRRRPCRRRGCTVLPGPWF